MRVNRFIVTGILSLLANFIFAADETNLIGSNDPTARPGTLEASKAEQTKPQQRVLERTSVSTNTVTTRPANSNTDTRPPAIDPSGRPSLPSPKEQTSPLRTLEPVSTRQPATFVPLEQENRPQANEQMDRVRPTGSNEVMLPSGSPVLPAVKYDAKSYEANEVIMMSENMQAARHLASKAATEGYRVKRRRQYKQLGFVITVFKIPTGQSVPLALKQLRKMEPSLMMDANHRYFLNGQQSQNSISNLVAWPPVDSTCGKGIRIGLLDTAVDGQHNSIPSDIITRSFLPLGVKAADPGHGTAIASILVGQVTSPIKGVLPAAQIYSASVFRQRAKEPIDTTAELLISGLDWLQGQKVHAINMSITGQPNQLLELSLRYMLQRDQLIVAAAGNQGKHAPAAFPALMPGVVAVTAVDSRLKVYKHANQGDYIDLAAPGVDVWAAKAGGRHAYFSGTSYAVPFVTAALAHLKYSQQGNDSHKLMKYLIKKAKDLGPKGQDSVYGHGLLQYSKGCF